MNTLFKKKKKGSIQNVFPVMIFLPICFILILMFVYFNHAMNKKSDFDSVARNYLLRMESRGGLTSSDEADLYADLEELGFYDVDITGTDRSDGSAGVGYGNEVTISISAKCDTYMLSSGGNSSFGFFIKEPKELFVQYSSTAKN